MRERDSLRIIKCIHVRRTGCFCFLYFSTLSITPITFAQLVVMKLVRTQYPMTGQHLHAWHDNDGKGGVAKQSECLKDPPCQLPFTVTLATTNSPLG